MVAVEKRKVKLTFTEPLLGTVPKATDLYTRFVASKNPEPEMLAEDEAEMAPVGQAGETGFYQDVDGIYLLDYHIKGFLKEAGNVLKAQLGVKALRSKIDNYLFIAPRHIYLKEEPDGVLERPIRAQTAQGPRVSLIRSDYVSAGTSIIFEIQLFRHQEVTWPLVAALLDYGQYKGLGQFRNGSYGRFSWQWLRDVKA